MSAALQNRNTSGLRPAWQPGQSGNKGQRPNGYRRVLAVARNASPEAMQKAVECMRDVTAPWAQRLKAVEIILDRAWGAPDQRLQVDGEGVSSITLNIVRPDAIEETVTVQTINGTAEPHAPASSISISTVKPNGRHQD